MIARLSTPIQNKALALVHKNHAAMIFFLAIFYSTTFVMSYLYALDAAPLAF